MSDRTALFTLGISVCAVLAAMLALAGCDGWLRMLRRRD